MGDAYGYSVGSLISIGSWLHVVFTYDGTQTGNANRLKLYVNGVQKTLSFAGTIPSTTPSNTNKFTIGKETDGVQRAFFGKIDDVRVFTTNIDSVDTTKVTLLASKRAYQPASSDFEPAGMFGGMSGAMTGGMAS
jgi:hypothetical protein